MSNLELRIYYRKKVTICLDVLDELERLQREPGVPGIVRQNAEEAKLEWEREFALASTQYDGVRSGLSTLPLPPQAMRDRLSALGDRVEQQINANQATNIAIDAASKLSEVVTEFRNLA